MEIVFHIITLFMIVGIVWMNMYIVNLIKKTNDRFDPIYRKHEEIIDLLYRDIEGIEKSIVILSEKIQSLPDIVKEDNYRNLLVLKQALEPAKPIKPNNWDSIKEAFSRPGKVDVGN